ncbi:hypothetical protein HanXRQr2_Chr11g0480531 [Helianthus annuus]|uniref:Uncharacterized protein n=1 Tax=Helianthus annuus TaxID=4232 RepID=A0A9K3HMV4_HELAN|nr:hypothetical protein HanXRQr2_Chr11g0480531 [Helianthus annuus]
MRERKKKDTNSPSPTISARASNQFHTHLLRRETTTTIIESVIGRCEIPKRTVVAYVGQHSLPSTHRYLSL